MAVKMSEGQSAPQLRTLTSTSTSWLFHGCSNTFSLSLEQPMVTFVVSGIEIHPVSPSWKLDRHSRLLPFLCYPYPAGYEVPSFCAFCVLLNQLPHFLLHCFYFRPSLYLDFCNHILFACSLALLQSFFFQNCCLKLYIYFVIYSLSIKKHISTGELDEGWCMMVKRAALTFHLRISI